MTTATENASAASPVPTTTIYGESPTDPLLMYGPITAARLPEGFERRPYQRITVTPAGTTIGAEIAGVRLDGDVDDDTMTELRQALLEWKVLFFRDQDISRADHRAFASLWGGLEQHPFFKYTQPGQTDVDVATLAKGMDSAGVENSWHNDVTWSATPSFGAVLRAVELPESGGDTLWADTAAAYDTLPQEIRDRIDGLVAEHDWLHAFGKSMPQQSVDMLRPHLPAVQHPLVRVIPETGRKVLFACQVFTTRILGISEEESTELLSILYRHIQRPEFQVRLRWRPDTVAFWDNRACQHYAASDYFPQKRVMDRISIVGDVPVGVHG
ncbi:TauD/TfdA dioxygenase family protein [Tomitella fengzijianii]|uniref:Taurine dioxygenase n=1 Tax=Tomitella fengzijianii TaxID=2597660 RepID=A0A516X1Y7_9ACTN|nr:TauD/TfdA family dioxygenase [Tomitella fengzijianii]QDQ97089.1 taurine dioxygenase [Tomitella fengzijianii]